MLVLSRRSRQAVVIGGADGLHRLLKVTVLEIRGTQVRLGFEVDADIPVHRLEVWERINRNFQATDGLSCEEPPVPVGQRSKYIK